MKSKGGKGAEVIHTHAYLFLFHHFSLICLFCLTFVHAADHLSSFSMFHSCVTNIFHSILIAFNVFYYFVVIYVSPLNPIRLVAEITQSSHGGHYCFILSYLTSTLPSLWLCPSLFNPPSLDPSAHYFCLYVWQNVALCWTWTCWRPSWDPSVHVQSSQSVMRCLFLRHVLGTWSPKVPSLWTREETKRPLATQSGKDRSRKGGRGRMGKGRKGGVC